MASSLFEKDYLSCCICFEEVKDPIGLPCLHEFCFECLDVWSKTSKDKTKVTCPLCKRAAPMPKEGIRGFPGHFLVKNLKETVDTEKKAQGTACSLCGKIANVHCTDCNKSLCQPCLKNHNAFIKDHKIVTVEELQSGQVTDEGRFCEVHGEQVRYYCETEQKGVCTDCVGLKTCPNDHHRTSVKDAAKKHASSINDLMTQCAHTRAKFQDAVQQTKKVLDDLNESEKQAVAELDQIHKLYSEQLNQIITKHKSEINKLKQVRAKDIEDKLTGLRLGTEEIDTACDQGSKIQESKSDHFITHKYSSLSETLEDLSQSQPVVVDRGFSHLRFEPANINIPFIGHIQQSERWKFCGQFVVKELTDIKGISIDESGNVAVACWEKGVKVYTRNDQITHTLYNSHGTADVAISPDNRCIFGPCGEKHMQCCDMQGKNLSTTPVTDVSNQPSNINSVAVDSKCRIIVGQVGNTISIHHADGSFISKFATQTTPVRLAITSNGEIISSFLDLNLNTRSLQLMEYSGCNTRVIQPPPEVTVWSPTYVCCGPGEIFVVNNNQGNPTGIYRYTAEGAYLGCVTNEVISPSGIALTVDGKELFVADFKGSLLKTFQRE